MGHVPSSTWKDGSPPQERLGQHLGTVLTCWAVGGLPSGISLEDCLFLVLLGEWTMPPPPPPNRAAPFLSSSGCLLEGGGDISHPPPSKTAFITISPPAEPQSLPLFPFVILPPLHPLLEKGSLVVHQVCGWRHIVPCVLGGVPLFPALYRHGTIEDHSCSGGPGPNLAAVCGFFPARAGLVLRRTWRGGINTELRWKYAVHQSFSWSSLPQRWTFASCCINGGLHCYSPAVLPASSFAPSVSLQHGGSQPLRWNGG